MMDKAVTPLPRCFKIDDKEITTDHDIAEGFNKYFANIGSHLASSIPSVNCNIKDFLPSSIPNSLYLSPVDCIETRSIINSLKNKTSSGVDEIPTSVIKFANEFIAIPLTKLINVSFNTGVFPDMLKIAKITPNYKSVLCFQIIDQYLSYPLFLKFLKKP